MRATVQVRGLKELRRALRAMEPGFSRQLSQALAVAAQPAAQLASERAPRLSGRLAGSIRAKPRGGGAAIGSPLEYAPVQEFADFGTPYLIPAIEDSADETVQAVELHVEQFIDGVLAHSGVLTA